MLKGARVLLRPMQEEDIPRQHEFFQDLELYGLDSALPRVSPREDAVAFYEGRTKHGDNIAPFAIEADGLYLGYCSLMHLQNPHGSLELGIMIGDRNYWGQGYGREVVGLLVDFAFYHLGARRIALTTHAKNERAIRCYLACGFVEEGRPRKAIWVEGEYVDLVEMSLLREEWQARATSRTAPAPTGG